MLYNISSLLVVTHLSVLYVPSGVCSIDVHCTVGYGFPRAVSVHRLIGFVVSPSIFDTSIILLVVCIRLAVQAKCTIIFVRTPI